MREESHLDDMRAAIRGDFERLEQRRGLQELMHVKEEEPEPQPTPELVRETAVAADASDLTEAPPGEIRVAEPDPETLEKRPSWLARLLAAIPPRQV